MCFLQSRVLKPRGKTLARFAWRASNATTPSSVLDNAVAAAASVTLYSYMDNLYIVGASDQVMAAFGGVKYVQFHSDDAISVDPLPLPPGRIADLNANIDPDGHIRVVGRGLLLATGNGIGTNARQSVHASLFCTSGTTVTEHDSNLAGVALDTNGDFRIDDYLSTVQPTTCGSPVLLIRNVGGVWFAAGIPKLETDAR